MSWWTSLLAWAGLAADPKAPGGRKRSPRWRKVRAEHLAAYPACRVCGKREHLEVHHVVPFHVAPELELQPLNLVTLCEGPGGGCHLRVGHLHDWRAWNDRCLSDAAFWRERIRRRSYKDGDKLV